MQFQLSNITTGTTRTLTVPNVNGTIVTTGDSATVTNAMLAGSIANDKLANIANSKLTNSSIVIGATTVSLGDTITALSGITTIGTSGNVTIGGTLTVNGTTTTINSTTLTVDDKNIELGAIATPTDATANGGGITLLGDTNKTIIWDSTNSNWTSSEHWNIASSKEFKINNTAVLSSTKVLGKTIGGTSAGDIVDLDTTQTLTNKTLSTGCAFPTLNQNTTGTAAGLSTTLSIASGGTNSSATPTAGGAGYGTGTAHAYTAAGTSGQVLTSQGNVSPIWQDLVVSIPIAIDGGGFAITTGVKFYLQIPFNCTITGWTMLANTSTTTVIDIWKDTYANFPPTVADTITGSAKPAITASNKNTSTTLTGWTTSITAGDILAFNVDSNNSATLINIALTAVKT
jgi:hypothetical protein